MDRVDVEIIDVGLEAIVKFCGFKELLLVKDEIESYIRDSNKSVKLVVRTVKMPKWLFERFKAVCEMRGTNISETIRKLVNDVILNHFNKKISCSDISDCARIGNKYVGNLIVVSFKVDKYKWEFFNEVCKLCSEQSSAVLRGMIVKWLGIERYD